MATLRVRFSLRRVWLLLLLLFSLLLFQCSNWFPICCWCCRWVHSIAHSAESGGGTWSKTLFEISKIWFGILFGFFCMIWNLLTCSSCANYSPSPSFSFSLTLLVYKQSALCSCSANSLPYGFSFPLQHHTHACLLPTLQIIIPPKKAYEFMKTSKKIYVWYMKTPEIMWAGWEKIPNFVFICSDFSKRDDWT